MSTAEVLALAEDYFPLEAAVLKASAFDTERSPGRSPLRVADSNWNVKEPGIPATCTLDRAFSRFARNVEDLESVCLHNDRLTGGPHTLVGASDPESTLVEDAERLILLSNKRNLSALVHATSANGSNIHDACTLANSQLPQQMSDMSHTNARKEARMRLAEAEEKLQAIQETCDEALRRAADLWKESGSLREALDQKNCECQTQAQELQELRAAIFLQSQREDDAAQAAEADEAERDNYHKKMNLALQEQLIQERSRREELERVAQGDRAELLSIKQAVDSISRQLSALQRQAHMHKIQIRENCESEKLAQEDKLMRTLDGFEKAFNTVLSGCDLWDVAMSASSNTRHKLSSGARARGFSAEHADPGSALADTRRRARGERSEHAATREMHHDLLGRSRASEVGATRREELRAPTTLSQVRSSGRAVGVHHNAPGNVSAVSSGGGGPGLELPVGLGGRQGRGAERIRRLPLPRSPPLPELVNPPGGR